MQYVLQTVSDIVHMRASLWDLHANLRTAGGTEARQRKAGGACRARVWRREIKRLREQGMGWRRIAAMLNLGLT